MESKVMEPDVAWYKDGRPINWNGRDWPLCKRLMMIYLTCVEVKENEIPLDAICDGTQVALESWTNARFKRQNTLLTKFTLSCTLAHQVMRFNSGQEILKNALCRYGADVENHLSYVLSLREQLAALDADVSDAWMVDNLVRSMSQFEYYQELHTLTLLGSVQMTTPLDARAMIITLQRNTALEREREKFSADITAKKLGRGGGVSVGKKRLIHDLPADQGRKRKRIRS